MARNNIQNINPHIIKAFVWWGTEMFAHICMESSMCDLAKVLAHPHHKFAFSLPYILMSARLAFDAVDDVGAFARHVLFGHVGSASGLGCDPPFCIKAGTIPAVVSGADIVGAGLCSVLRGRVLRVVICLGAY